MDDRHTIWHAAQRLAQSGERAAIATVSRKRGSLPMAGDAKMVMTADGKRWGTVGGGCVEADVMEQALHAAASGEPTFVRHTLNADVAGDIGLSCGGTAEFFLEPLVQSREMANLYGVIAKAIEERCRATVFTATGWAGKPGKMVHIDTEVTGVGNVNLPRSVNGTEPAATSRQASAYLDEESGVFVEPLERMPRVIIFGAGHVGAEIAKVASGVGFHVVISDDREDFANPQRLPWAHEVIAEHFRSVLDRLVLDEDDFVLATTRGHSYDAYIVERTAGSRARYVGMLGSKRKQAVIWKALEKAGVSCEDLHRVHVPIGDAIGADTPAEIAVAVVAEMIRLRRLGEPS